MGMQISNKSINKCDNTNIDTSCSNNKEKIGKYEN